MVALAKYDEEVLESVFKRPGTGGEVMWEYCDLKGKSSILPEHPKMNCAWRCKTSDSYAKFMEDTRLEFAEDVKSGEYAFVDLGNAHLSMFFGERKLAQEIAKNPEGAQDDLYYFGGEEGKQDKVNEVIEKHYAELTAPVTCRHTPEKKKHKKA